MRVFMERYDLLLTPTLPIAAFEAGKLSPADDGKAKWVYWTPFSYPFNLTQQPAASVPCGFTKAGLPIGLHIVGKMFDDRTVLRASQAYEGATEWGRSGRRKALQRNRTKWKVEINKHPLIHTSVDEVIPLDNQPCKIVKNKFWENGVIS